MAEYSELKVAELKELLKARSLATSGNKAELVRRLEESESQESAKPVESTEENLEVTETIADTDQEQPVNNGDQTVATEEKSEEKEADAAAAAASVGATVGADSANGQQEKTETIQETAAPAENVDDSTHSKDVAVADESSGPKAEGAEATTEVANGSSGENVSANNGEEEEAPIDEERQAEVIAELEKRAARARRFGEGDEEIERQLARVKKFGAASIKPINDLSRALPTHNRRGPNSSSRRHRRGGRGYGGPGYDRRQEYDDRDDYYNGSNRDHGESSDKLESRRARFDY